MSLAHFPLPLPACPCGLCSPATAPALLVSAGPFSSEAALSMVRTARALRRHCRFLLPAWYDVHAGLNDSAIFLDANPRGRTANLRALREAVRWMRRGGVLVVFDDGNANAAALGRLERLGSRPPRAPLRLVPRLPARA